VLSLLDVLCHYIYMTLIPLDTTRK